MIWGGWDGFIASWLSLAENNCTNAPNKDNLCTMKTTSTRKAEYIKNLKPYIMQDFNFN